MPLLLLRPPLRRVGAASTPRLWVCAACRSRLLSPFQRRHQTPPSTSTSTSSAPLPLPLPSKPYYVTTPIFYVNAAPHLGHLHSMVLADVIARWQRLQGRTALLSTGTDEHGLKVQQAAERAGLAPQDLCDQNSAGFRRLAEAARVSHDRFARTTDSRHGEAVAVLWERLVRSGHVYKASRTGWYGVGDECFYSDDEVVRSSDPLTGRLMVVARETEGEVTHVTEENYHFRLSAFRQRLLDFYESVRLQAGVGSGSGGGSESGGESGGESESDGFVTPAHSMAEVVSWVDTKLVDLSISRPSSRIRWGIPVPGDSSQTVYVWVDALANYIAQAGYPTGWTDGHSDAARAAGWPADLHVIGKDIVRFHCVYWPALLMAAGLPPPRRVLVHAHWTMGARKMSKSAGNVVEPFAALSRWGVDPLRYFLMAEAGELSRDRAYDNGRVYARVKKGLHGQLGNALKRVAMPRDGLWSVEQCVREMMQVRKWDPLEDAAGDPLAAALVALPAAFKDKMDRFQITAALRLIDNFIVDLNRYWEKAKPWDNDTLKDPSGRDGVTKCVFLAAEGMRMLCIALQPVMPDSMATMLDLLGVKESRRGWAHAAPGADDHYGARMAGLEDHDGIVFPQPPLEEEREARGSSGRSASGSRRLAKSQNA